MSTDVRAWLREQGHEVPSRGPVPARLRELYDAGNPPADVAYDPPAREEVSAPDQPAPVVREPTKIERAKAKWSQRKQAADRPTARGGRAPRRASTEGFFSGVWSYGAQIIGVKAELLPMARVMALQAPVAGVIIEDGIKGSAVDRMVQPLARMANKGNEISALLGPPLLVALISQQPQLYPLLHDPLYSSLVAWCKLAGPALKKKKAEMEALAADMAELGEQFNAAPGEDFIEAWIQGFFAGSSTDQEPVNQDSARDANGRFVKQQT